MYQVNPFAASQDRGALQHVRHTDPGSIVAPQDVRTLPDNANITELFPDVYLLHCCDSQFIVDPANGAQQDFVVGRWNLPYDVGVLAVRYEFFIPDVGGCAYGYLRAGQNISTQPQTSHIIDNNDAFWSEISGSVGIKVRVQDNINPYFRRAVKHADITACLQMFSVLGQAPYAVEYMLQARVLKINFMQASGRYRHGIRTKAAHALRLGRRLYFRRDYLLVYARRIA